MFVAFPLFRIFSSIDNSIQFNKKANYVIPLYHFHPLHKHLDISRTIAAERSSLHIALDSYQWT